MSDEQTVASESGGSRAQGRAAEATGACDTVTDLLDALHRASFEAWWLRVHPPRRARHAEPSAEDPTRHPLS